MEPVTFEQFLGYVVLFFKTYFIFIACVFSLVTLIGSVAAFFMIKSSRRRKNAVESMIGRFGNIGRF